MKYSDWKTKSHSPLTEALRGKTVVFTFGRFQPPTSGHQKLVDALARTAEKNNAIAYLFPARTNDPKRNPLSPGVKIKWLRKFFGDKVKVMDSAAVKTMFDALQMFKQEGVKKVIMVVGGDRVAEMRDAIKPYIGKKGSKDGYQFEFQVVSAGERDPDAEGVVGMSASKMRAAAGDNDMKAFMNGIPSGVSKAEAEMLFRELRRAMSLKESVNESVDSLVEVGTVDTLYGTKLKFWLDEQEDVYYAVQLDAEGNATEGGYGTMETMMSMYPEAWRLFREQMRTVISRRAKHRRTEDTYNESLLQPWMLRLQSIRESGWGAIAALQYMMRTPCEKRELAMSALDTPKIVQAAYKVLKQEYDLKKEFESDTDSAWKRRDNQMLYQFHDLFVQAMKSKRESDWKQVQQFACRNKDLRLNPKIAALITAGPASA